MQGFDDVLSFELAGDMANAKQFLEALETVTLAVSLGGVEGLAELPAAMTHEPLSSAARDELGISETLIRLSVGIEAVEDLRADLERSFTALES